MGCISFCKRSVCGSEAKKIRTIRVSRQKTLFTTFCRKGHVVNDQPRVKDAQTHAYGRATSRTLHADCGLVLAHPDTKNWDGGDSRPQHMACIPARNTCDRHTPFLSQETEHCGTSLIVTATHASFFAIKRAFCHRPRHIQLLLFRKGMHHRHTYILMHGKIILGSRCVVSFATDSTLPYPAPSCPTPTLFLPTLPCSFLPYPTISCSFLPYPTMFLPTLPYLAPSYPTPTPTLSYTPTPTLPYPIQFVPIQPCRCRDKKGPASTAWACF